MEDDKPEGIEIEIEKKVTASPKEDEGYDEGVDKSPEDAIEEAMREADPMAAIDALKRCGYELTKVDGGKEDDKPAGKNPFEKFADLEKDVVAKNFAKGV